MVVGSAGKSLKISELDYYFAAILYCQPFSSACFFRVKLVLLLTKKSKLLDSHAKFKKHFGWKPEKDLTHICDDLLNYWRELL